VTSEPPDPRPWLADPGALTLGATFRTALYLDGIDSAPLARLRLEIVFDPRMLYCVAVEPPPPGGPPVSQDAAIAVGRIAAAFEIASESCGGLGRPVPLATLRWRCVGEGTTEVLTRLTAPDARVPSRLRIVQRPRV
jgi:hypothetical protein